MHTNGKPVMPSGDMGIGLCLHCVGEVLQGRPVIPQFGVTLAPMLHQQPGPQGMMGAFIAAPICWNHLKAGQGNGDGQPRRNLLVAQGGLPK